MSLSDSEILAFLPSIRRAAKAFARGGTLDAEDLTQGSVEKLVREARNGSEIISPAWMMSVAQHHFIDEARKARLRQTFPIDGDVLRDVFLGDENEGFVFNKSTPTVRANAEDAVALSEALEELGQTKRGRELVAFVVDGDFPSQKKERFYARRDLRRVMG